MSLLGNLGPAPAGVTAYDFSLPFTDRAGMQQGCPPGYGAQFVPGSEWGDAYVMGADGFPVSTVFDVASRGRVRCLLVSEATPARLQADSTTFWDETTIATADVLHDFASTFGFSTGMLALLAVGGVLLYSKATRPSVTIQRNPAKRCPWRATSKDECCTMRERSVAGTSKKIPRCPKHGKFTE